MFQTIRLHLQQHNIIALFLMYPLGGQQFRHLYYIIEHLFSEVQRAALAACS